jgi:hypothetical protein
MFKKLWKFIRIKNWDRKNPQTVRPYGIWIFTGLPGKGKTLSLSEYLFQCRKKFPSAKIYTNFGWKQEDGSLSDWKQLIDLDNGEDGIIFGIDEVHSLFGRKDWKDIPKEVLSLFSQNRKMSKQIVCTAQTFGDVLIDIRRRTHFVISCITFAKRWVFQRAYSVQDYSDEGERREKRRTSWKYSFIADNSIYESYDTYKFIETLKKSKLYKTP